MKRLKILVVTAFLTASGLGFAQTSSTGALESDTDKSTLTASVSAETGDDSSVSDVIDSAKDLFSAVKDKKWSMAIALLVSLLTLAIRKWPWLVKSKIPWLATDRGGVVLVLATSLLASLSTAVIGGAAWSFSLLARAAETAAMAIGGYQGIKRLFWPKDSTTS